MGIQTQKRDSVFCRSCCQETLGVLSLESQIGTNQLFVVAPAQPIGSELGYCVGGPLKCFHSTLSISVSSPGVGAGLIRFVCMHACIFIYTCLIVCIHRCCRCISKWSLLSVGFLFFVFLHNFSLICSGSSCSSMKPVCLC